MTIEPDYTADERQRAREMYEGELESAASYRTDERWERIPEEKVPVALGSVGLMEMNCGRFALVFDSFEDARTHFEQAAQYYLESATKRVGADLDTGTVLNTPVTYAKAMYAALLSGDADRIRESAEAASELPSETKIPWGDSYDTLEFDSNKHTYAMALAATCLERDGEAADYLDSLSIDDERPGKLRDLYTGVSSALRRILTEDSDKVCDGLSVVLSRHQRIIDEGGDARDVGELVLSVEATALVVLARSRGLEVGVESEYVPTEYVEWLTIRLN